MKGGISLSQFDKLISDILAKNQNLRFEDLRRVLIRLGYTEHQPRGGSSHYTFRKKGRLPITIPKQVPLKRTYIELVADVIREYDEEDLR